MVSLQLKTNLDITFKVVHLPKIQAEHEKDGNPNIKARKEGYQQFLRNCRKFNMITEHHLKTWKLPKKLETLIVIIR